jgi:hypothetical protein
MADKEQDIIRDAIIGTNQEIFAEAFGKEDLKLDETGDRSREEMGDGLEGQHEPDEDEDEDEAEGEAEETPEEVAAKTTTEPEAKVEPKVEEEVEVDSKGRVPSGILRDRTEKLRAAETERDALKARLDAAEAESQRKIDALRAEFLTALRQQPRPADQPKHDAPKPADAPPDLFENPTAFAEFLRNGVKSELAAMQQQMREDRINASMESAKTRHGDTFVKAFTALQTVARDGSPDGRALAQRLTASPNPGEAVVAWHKRTETLREVGDDPTAYKAKIADDTRKSLMADPDFRKQLLDNLRAEAMTGDNGNARTTTRLPASLNRAAGGNTRAPNDLEIFDGSDQATFDSAFNN